MVFWSLLRTRRDILVMESVFQCAYMTSHGILVITADTTRHTRHGKCIPVCVYDESWYFGHYCGHDETYSSWKVYSSVRIWRVMVFWSLLRTRWDILVMESLFQCAYMTSHGILVITADTTRHTRHGKCIPVCVYDESWYFGHYCGHDETYSSWKVYSSVRIWRVMVFWQLMRTRRDILVMESVFQCAYMTSHGILVITADTTRHTRHGKCIPVCVYDESWSFGN